MKRSHRPGKRAKKPREYIQKKLRCQHRPFYVHIEEHYREEFLRPCVAKKEVLMWGLGVVDV